MAKKKYYAVAQGHKTGIFTDWSSCEAQVKGVKGARYKSFVSRKEAENWLRDPVYQPKNTVQKKPGKNAVPHVETQPLPADAIEIYTDGSAINNPGPGGYGLVICDAGGQREISGGYRHTTNNRMELMAAIIALEEMQGSPRPLVLYTDSRYLLDGIMKGWAKRWRSNGWMKADKTPALNSDLWARLLDVLETVRVEFRWVKGHAGNPLNERCDQLAGVAARQPERAIDEGYEKDS
ncbi:MAG: ribonuclease HI [Deltaproteobacteria bacterium]|nr:MAG: ribonuclease HI [Deltaproteobacteria bacterium]